MGKNQCERKEIIDLEVYVLFVSNRSIARGSNTLYQSSCLNSIGEGRGGGQEVRGVGAGLGADQVVEGWGVGDARGEVGNVIEVSKGLQDRRGAVRLRLTGSGVDAVVLKVSLGSEGGDEPGGHAATVAVEVQSVVLTIGRSFGVGQVVRADRQRGWNVVVETTGLIVGDEEQAALPERTVAKRLIDLLDKDLTVRHVAAGVHRVGVRATARRVDVGQGGQLTQVGILEEVLHGDNTAWGILGGPVEEESVGQESTVRPVIVQPADSLLCGRLEDRQNVNAGDIEAIIVLSMPRGGTCESA